MTFGERLRELRGKVPVTHVAEMVGVDDQSVHAWERGLATPTRANWEKLKGVFPELPEPVFSGRGGNVSRVRRGANWNNKVSSRPCVDDQPHKWWYNATKALRVCDRCDAVERRDNDRLG